MKDKSLAGAAPQPAPSRVSFAPSEPQPAMHDLSADAAKVLRDNLWNLYEGQPADGIDVEALAQETARRVVSGWGWSEGDIQEGTQIILAALRRLSPAASPNEQERAVLNQPGQAPTREQVEALRARWSGTNMGWHEAIDAVLALFFASPGQEKP